MENFGRSLDGWADRLARFNRARTPLLAGVGGAIGLGISIAEGNFVLWTALSTVFLVIVLAAMLAFNNQVPKISPALWLCLALAPFFNQILFVTPQIYWVACFSIVTGLLLPPLLRAVSVFIRFRREEPLT